MEVEKKYTWGGLLFALLWRVVLPGTLVAIILMLMHLKVIPEHTPYDGWIVNITVAFITGTGIGAITSIYYLLMIFFQD